MDALVKTEAGKGLKLMQVPVPEPKMGEVRNLRHGCSYI